MRALIPVLVVIGIGLGAVAYFGEKIPAIRPKTTGFGFKAFKFTVYVIIALSIIALLLVAAVTLGVAIVQNLT